MGIVPPGQRQKLNMQKATKDFFEPQLSGIGLSEAQINRLSLEELEQCLIRIDDGEHSKKVGKT